MLEDVLDCTNVTHDEVVILEMLQARWMSVCYPTDESATGVGTYIEKRLEPDDVPELGDPFSFGVARVGICCE